MSQKSRMDPALQCPLSWVGPSEPESHIEHAAALEATIFRPNGDCFELVLELDAGELRLRRTPGS
jgi:hypothetical protein